MPDGAPPLEVSSLGHTYAHEPVLGGIDLTLGPGELLAVLGPSGCGKTTLLRSVAGLVTPRKGVIRVGGRTVCEDGRDLVPVERRGVGVVFQDYALFPHMTVAENVRFGLGGRGDIASLLELVGLGELADRKPAELSGGQQQRTALARALAPAPHLLLLDEPFANVDGARRAQLGQELVRILGERGTSALIVTHDQADAMAHASRLAVLVPASGGASLAQLGAPEALYQRPKTREVASYLGPVAFLPARAQGAAADSSLGRVQLVEAAEGEVTLVLRPEQARFVADDAGPAEVLSRAYLGRGFRLRCATSRGEVEVHAGLDAPPVSARGRVEVTGALWALPR
jgi:iron(III) transport system ATP-binding protein